MNVALPAIQKGLHARLAGLQWIMDAYLLVAASFMMLAGSIRTAENTMPSAFQRRRAGNPRSVNQLHGH